MGDASSFDKDEEPEQLVLDDSIDISVSSWIRNDVGADELKDMVKRKRLNVFSLIGSHTQVEEQRATSAQHQEQSQAQQSEQSEEVRGGGQQSHEEQSQPSLGNINCKKVRGVTLMSEIWELPEGQRVIVKINNLFQPVGEESTCLCRFIGTMVRKAEFVPINYLNWHEMPNNRKEEM
ncbi:hypothetical protein V6N13_024972 [Hibiscus sabdariffa]